MNPLPDLYRTMARVRALNDDAVALQRQGAIYGFAPCTGQEASQVGSADAIDPTIDFAFPTYREFGAMIALGVDPVGLLAHHRGYADGGLLGPAARYVAPMNAVVGGTALHAVGWAMGAKLDGTQACAIAYFGDGASSQGEVHEAMNFAGAFQLPVVFFCQNNQWAISVPVAAQVAGGSVAARAGGYGMAGLSVDGNDVLAVRDATAAAVTRARAGGGPTLIEAMTYRLGPHATSDDPSRYRTREEEQAWEERAPLTRAKKQLLDSGAVDEEFFRGVEAATAEETVRVREALSALEPPTMREHVDLTYQERPAASQAQVDAWLAGGVYA